MSLTFNPYDLLDENGGDRLKKAPKQAAPKPAPKPAVDATKAPAAPQSKAAPAKSAPATGGAAPAGKKENDARPRPQGDAQRPRGPAREGGNRSSPSQPRQNQQGGAPAAPRTAGGDAAVGDAVEKPRERRDRDHRTHDRPDRRGRQFDRRSGTGRPANENKKGGSGRGNWGKETEDGQETEVPKVEGEAEKEETVAPVEGEAAAEPPKEPEQEFLSLDEYLATKKVKPIEGVEAPKLRAAGEGVDASAWADYAPLEKDSDDAPAKKKKESKKAAANGKDEKVSVDKLFRVTMPPHEGARSEERRGRGKGPGGFGKSGGRGAGGRGQGQQGGQAGGRPGADRRSNNKTDAGVSLADQSQFPSLGGGAPAQSAPAPVKA